MTLQKCGN